MRDVAVDEDVAEEDVVEEDLAKEDVVDEEEEDVELEEVVADGGAAWVTLTSVTWSVIRSFTGPLYFQVKLVDPQLVASGRGLKVSRGAAEALGVADKATF